MKPKESNGFAKIFNLVYVFQKDHDSNCMLHRHICAYCLSMGKQLGHAEKDLPTREVCQKTTQGLPVIRAGQPENVVKPSCESIK